MPDNNSIFDLRRFDEDGELITPPPPVNDEEDVTFITFDQDVAPDRPPKEPPTFQPLFVAQPATDATETEDAPAPAAEAEEPVAEPAEETDVNFDAVPEAEETAVEEPVAETFSAEDLEAARKAAYDEGLQAGLAQAEESKDARLAAAQEQIGAQLEQSNQTAADEIADAAADALAIGVSLVKQLFPTLRTKLADREIRAFVKNHLGDAGEARTLKVQAHPDLADQLGDQLTAMVEKSGFQGTVSVQADPELEPGDVRLDWREGGVERLYETLWKGLDAALMRSIGPTEPSDKAKASKPAKKAPAAAAKPAKPASTPQPATTGA